MKTYKQRPKEVGAIQFLGHNLAEIYSVVRADSVVIGEEKHVRIISPDYVVIDLFPGDWLIIENNKLYTTPNSEFKNRFEEGYEQPAYDQLLQEANKLAEALNETIYDAERLNHGEYAVEQVNKALAAYEKFKKENL